MALAQTAPVRLDRPAVIAAAVGLLAAPLVAMAATLEPVLAAAGAVTLAAVVVFFRSPRLGAYFLVLTYTFNLIHFRTGFAYLGLGDIACLLVVPVWLMYRLARPRGLRLPRGWPLLAIFLGLCFVSMMLGVEPSRAYGGYLRTVTYVLGAAVIVDLGADERFLHRAIWITALAGLVHSVAALRDVGSGVRLEGLVQQPNILALLVGMGAICALSLSERERRPWVRAGLLVSLGLMLLVIALTISRGTYLALGVTVMWWARRSRIQLALAALATLAVAYVTEGAGRQDLRRIEHRLEGRDGGSALNRLETARNAVRGIMSHPVLGVGFGQFLELEDAIEVTTQADRGAHNFYLGTAAESGIPALFMLLAFLGLTLRRLWARRREAIALGPPGRAVGQTIRTFQALAIFMAVSLLTKGQGKTRFWITVGLASAASAVRLGGGREPDDTADARPVATPPPT